MRLHLLPFVAALGLASACHGDDPSDDTDAPGTDDTEAVDTQVADTDLGPLVAPRPVWRLSAEEIRRSVRDVLGVDLDTRPFLPADTLNRGFDSVDAASALTAGFVDRMVDLASEVADRALEPTIELPGATPLHVVEAEHLHWSEGGFAVFYAKDVVWWALQAHPLAQATIEVPEGGPWTIEAEVTLQPGSEIPLDGALKVGDLPRVNVFELATGDDHAPEAFPEVVTLGTTSAAGPTTVSMRLFQQGDVPLQAWSPDEDVNSPRGPAIAVDRFVFYGEATAPTTLPSPARQQLVTCEPDADDPEPCLRQILLPVARRLWRRDLTTDEQDAVVALARGPMDQGGTLDQGLKLALQGLLVSPSFLFKLDVDEDTVDADGRRLQPYEVATRLAYTIWSGPPDDALLDCAAQGGLADTDDACGLRAQTARMMQSPASSALVERFVAGWLRMARADGFFLVPWFYPFYAEPTPASLREEHRRLVSEFVQDDLDLRDLVTADHAWLNQPLGNLYGDDVEGFDFRRVERDVPWRSGILTQGAVLVGAGNGSTSPVRRAVWVASALLCLDLPPPPSAVAPLPDLGPSGDAADQLEQHLSNPACRGCHEKFEGYGRVLGTYDLVGGRMIDAQGRPQTPPETTLPDGTVVRNAEELGHALRADPRLGRCIAEHMLVWALGHEVDHDDAALDDVVAEAEAAGFSAGALIEAVVTHPRFREASP